MNNEYLLLDEYPLIVFPSLACKLGLHEAMILQQIHYWLIQNKRSDKNFKDGYHWTYNSYKQWQQQFPFWSMATVRRAINQLESLGILISGEYNKKAGDRSKWYRIDYSRLTSDKPSAQIEHMQLVNEDKSFSQDGLLNTRDYNRDYLTDTNNNIPEGSKPSPPLKKSTTDTALIIKQMQQYYGFPETEIDPIPNYGKEGKAIKRMLDRGFTSEQIIDLWKTKVESRGQFVSMVYVNEDIQPAPVIKSNNNRFYYINILCRRYARKHEVDPGTEKIEEIRAFVDRCLDQDKNPLKEVDNATIKIM